jgi:hypothetical protein
VLSELERRRAGWNLSRIDILSTNSLERDREWVIKSKLTLACNSGELMNLIIGMDGNWDPASSLS